MLWLRPSVLAAILTLLLTACWLPSSSPAIGVQAAQRPSVTQPAAPAAPRTLSAASRRSVLPATDVPPDGLPATCPVTRPPDPPFTPAPPYSRSAPSADEFWYGTDWLWAAVPSNGVWSSLPHNPDGYTQKVFWWRKDYSWTAEPEPRLSVTGRRLDAQAPPLNVSRATNAFAADIQSAMLVGVDFPTLGCWEITGQYAGTELSFVVWVAP